MHALRIQNTGVNITTGAASASAAIPDCSTGNPAKYILVSATAAAHVRLGSGSATAVATDVMVTPYEPLVLNAIGYDTIAAIQDSAAGKVNVAPLECA